LSPQNRIKIKDACLSLFKEILALYSMKIQSKDLGLLKQLINKLEQERGQALVAAEDANIQLQIIAEQYLAQSKELEACKTSLEAHRKLLDDKEKAAQHYHSALIRSARQIRQEEADRSMIFEELQLVRDQAEARWRLLLPGAPAGGSLEPAAPSGAAVFSPPRPGSLYAQRRHRPQRLPRRRPTSPAGA
jgi:hypothetical protein